VFEDACLGDFVEANAAALFQFVAVFFRLNSIDLVCQNVAALVDILDYLAQAKQAWIPAAHDRRVVDSSREEIDTAHNRLISVIILGHNSSRGPQSSDIFVCHICHLFSRALAANTNRSDLENLTESGRTSASYPMFQEYIQVNAGRYWAPLTD
jgi:hypothetical protein